MSTPLFKKLGLKSGMVCLLINRPNGYINLIQDKPADIAFIKSAKEGSCDFIHLFVKSEEELVDRFIHAKPLIKKDGMIWVSWPKKSSKIETDINRESVREFGLDIGLVDVKICSINEDWSALKFVYRLIDR